MRKMAIADFEEIRGDLQAAMKVAHGVLPIAQAMGYQMLAEQAQELVQGNTELMRIEAQIKSKDYDERTSKWSDDEVRDFARNVMAAKDIPSDRYAVVERECFATRERSRVRIEWCQFLELKSDTTHELSMETIFLRDPNRGCVCGMHGHCTKITHPDASTVINAFKGTYCQACCSRSPKGKGV